MRFNQLTLPSQMDDFVSANAVYKIDKIQGVPWDKIDYFIYQNDSVTSTILI